MAIDRTLVLAVLQCAARFNKDGSVESVIGDSNRLLDWVDGRVAERRRTGDPVFRTTMQQRAFPTEDGLG